MKKYRIISDGSCDLPDELAKERNISVVPFYVSMDDDTYRREGIDVTKEEFYNWMVENPTRFPKSSMPSTQEFLDAFTDAANAGEDIICICITRKFSASYQSAVTAAQMFADEHPDTRVTVINSMVNTVLQGLVVLEACDLRDAGKSYDEVVSGIEAILESGRIFFTIGSIDYLKNGGRIGKLAGIAGTLLGIKPVITLEEGEISNSGIARSRKKAIDKVITLMTKYVRDTFSSADEYAITIGYGYDYDESLMFRKLVTDALSAIGHHVTIPIFRIGAAISVHTGPHPLGVGIVRRAHA